MTKLLAIFALTWWAEVAAVLWLLTSDSRASSGPPTAAVVLWFVYLPGGAVWSTWLALRSFRRGTPRKALTGLLWFAAPLVVGEIALLLVMPFVGVPWAFAMVAICAVFVAHAATAALLLRKMMRPEPHPDNSRLENVD
ncbi:MAG TPA: hypothetical protein VEA69_00230 [Tepidisphaeraceae bacterium]|nr:hypothetical protein [Tepidisphaeraceae bacterium]